MSTKRKATTIAKPVVKQSAKAASKTRIDEAQTTVSTGLSATLNNKQEPEIIELSDSDSATGAVNNDEELGDDEQLDQQIASETRSGESGDVEMENTGDASDGEDQPSEPTFGELLRGNSTVDVSAAVAAQAANANSRTEIQQRHAAGLISNNSLATVLNQALRTNDTDLLESCLQTTDNGIIENTVNRMDSALAPQLLDHLSARMHRRPGRALSLMMWMKLTMIAHGGSLVTNPDRIARMGELQRVLQERAKGLPVLQQLKGKLDLLDAQLKLRKTARLQAAGRWNEGDGHDVSSDDEGDDDEARMVYVEEEESHSRPLANGVGPWHAVDDEDDFPAANGVIGDSDEESDEDFGEEQEELAEVESMDEDEVDHDDVEDEEEEISEAEAEPPTKIRRTSARLSQKK
ncbi:U3 small nucleolar RNA-associated protein 5 [Podospora fimiseda]|uniref:U3 small nucleolar RNA-associated protein 5 n=1 Tax=Podospora fimiseda TaxID=252190 RepID=A0AAN7BI05_9PEZI|nr:U3 small nucleolar RNA-associated protein 5 [Podospora fimiseda]